jgi:pyruvate dehydrogenase E1 component alpha subunit
MYLIREAEQYIIDHYAEDEMRCPMHMSRGQEHIAAGVISAVGDWAMVFGSYRSHAAYLARTDDLTGFFAELYGKPQGPNGGRAGSMHIDSQALGYWYSSGIVAAQIPLAVGAAWAFKQAKSDQVTVVFFGDGAVDEGAFWESLNLACVLRVPVLFVLEDNGLAVHSRTVRRWGHGRHLSLLCDFNVCHEEAHGTDARKVRDVAADVLHQMDQTGRPGFLVTECCRYLEHVGINEDYDDGYRTRPELDAWLVDDPVAIMRAAVAVGDGFTLALLEESIQERVRETAEWARALSLEAVSNGA